MRNKTYYDYKKWLVEKNKKSPFYTKAYKFILERYNSGNTEKFYIEEIEKEILKDYNQVENADFIDEESIKRNIQICINQVIDNLCIEQKIKYLGVEEGKKYYQCNIREIEKSSIIEETQK